MAANPYARKSLMALWKQGWNEIPEVMSSSIFFVGSIIAIPFFMSSFKRNDLENHRYKVPYVVYRPEDPRVQRIKKHPDSPKMTNISDFKL